ncbi:signal transduction histidine kinase [Neoasaia chiangmaiensis NBRC 101099]|uniref:histidine kinase n=1 Tax=Neoasaia chiangmaiensis TaxID=320497 RepID=A0A1U9KPE4_9PROT|nr:HWE histidine kinase domain-containing protein [Neoasaia chiangmaiensis]AQS87691.1 hypothetical protein A0U93_06825 [Neoasaia chiangmaiensis]GBR41842.1 signal transduction histidine kinase [Neoasaia chiangmaiensis NBRC 101099]GEN14278.1 hypothetical protein NCH01_07090 [Neoasaia chiangmaiensis]
MKKRQTRIATEPDVDSELDDYLIAAAALCRTPIAALRFSTQNRSHIVVHSTSAHEDAPIRAWIDAFLTKCDAPHAIDDPSRHPSAHHDDATPDCHVPRFCAGCPLPGSDDNRPDILCVFDAASRPSDISEQETAGLAALARRIRHALDVRKAEKQRASREVDEARRLIASERAHRALLQHYQTQQDAGIAGGIGTFELDLQTERMSVSPQMCRLFGLPIRARYPLHAFVRLVVPDDLPLVWGAGEMRAGKGALQVIYRIRRANDGAERWLVRRGSFEGDEGRPRRMIGTIHDITKEREAADRLNALITIGDRLRDAFDRQSVTDIVTQGLGETLRVGRVGYARYDADQKHFTVERCWHPPTMPPFGESAIEADFPITIRFLSGGSMLTFDDVDSVSWLQGERDVYRRHGVRAGISIPFIEHGALSGILFIHNPDPRQWLEREMNFVRAIADRLDIAMAGLKAHEQQQTINEEISHRLKNTLMLVQALAHQSLRDVADREAVKTFSSRLITLSSAHDILMKKNWQSSNLCMLAERVLGKLGFDTRRILLEGPDVQLGPNTTTALSMVLHELTTNAMKFGSLSKDSGQVRVVWHIDATSVPPTLHLRWKESGGPPVTPPAQTGTGSRVLKNGLGGGGGLRLNFEPDGVCAELWVPLDHAMKA